MVLGSESRDWGRGFSKVDLEFGSRPVGDIMHSQVCEGSQG